jgi:hypothetical protein
MKKMNTWLSMVTVVIILFSCSGSDKVNKAGMILPNMSIPFIGTGFHGHVFRSQRSFWCRAAWAGEYVGRMGLVFGISLFGFNYWRFAHASQWYGRGDLGDISLMPVIDSAEHAYAERSGR